MHAKSQHLVGTLQNRSHTAEDMFVIAKLHWCSLGKAYCDQALTWGKAGAFSCGGLPIGARPPGLIPSFGDWALTIVAMPLLPWYLAVRS